MTFLLKAMGLVEDDDNSPSNNNNNNRTGSSAKSIISSINSAAFSSSSAAFPYTIKEDGYRYQYSSFYYIDLFASEEEERKSKKGDRQKPSECFGPTSTIPLEWEVREGVALEESRHTQITNAFQKQTHQKMNKDAEQQGSAASFFNKRSKEVTIFTLNLHHQPYAQHFAQNPNSKTVIKEVMAQLIKKLKSFIMLPNILRVYDVKEEGHIISLATEPCVPLSLLFSRDSGSRFSMDYKKFFYGRDEFHLQNETVSGQSSGNKNNNNINYVNGVALGIRQIAECLTALHKNNYYHGNINLNSIFIHKPTGHWRLFGFELCSQANVQQAVSANNNNNDANVNHSLFLSYANRFMPTYRLHPHIRSVIYNHNNSSYNNNNNNNILSPPSGGGGENKMITNDLLLFQQDAWGLGCLLYEFFALEMGKKDISNFAASEVFARQRFTTTTGGAPNNENDEWILVGKSALPNTDLKNSFDLLVQKEAAPLNRMTTKQSGVTQASGGGGNAVNQSVETFLFSCAFISEEKNKYIGASKKADEFYLLEWEEKIHFIEHYFLYDNYTADSNNNNNNNSSGIESMTFCMQTFPLRSCVTFLLKRMLESIQYNPPYVPAVVTVLAAAAGRVQCSTSSGGSSGTSEKEKNSFVQVETFSQYIVPYIVLLFQSNDCGLINEAVRLLFSNQNGSHPQNSSNGVRMPGEVIQKQIWPLYRNCFYLPLRPTNVNANGTGSNLANTNYNAMVVKIKENALKNLLFVAPSLTPQVLLEDVLIKIIYNLFLHCDHNSQKVVLLPPPAVPAFKINAVVALNHIFEHAFLPPSEGEGGSAGDSQRRAREHNSKVLQLTFQSYVVLLKDSAGTQNNNNNGPSAYQAKQLALQSIQFLLQKMNSSSTSTNNDANHNNKNGVHFGHLLENNFPLLQYLSEGLLVHIAPMLTFMHVGSGTTSGESLREVANTCVQLILETIKKQNDNLNRMEAERKNKLLQNGDANNNADHDRTYVSTSALWSFLGGGGGGAAAGAAPSTQTNTSRPTYSGTAPISSAAAVHKANTTTNDDHVASSSLFPDAPAAAADAPRATAAAFPLFSNAAPTTSTTTTTTTNSTTAAYNNNNNYNPTLPAANKSNNKNDNDFGWSDEDEVKVTKSAKTTPTPYNSNNRTNLNDIMSANLSHFSHPNSNNNNSHYNASSSTFLSGSATKQRKKGGGLGGAAKLE